MHLGIQFNVSIFERYHVFRSDETRRGLRPVRRPGKSQIMLVILFELI